jgi:hypothetical protein
MLLQQSSEVPKTSFEEENRRLFSELVAALESRAVLEDRILQSEAERADFEAKLETRTNELSAERAGRLKAMEEADTARQLLEAVSNSRVSLAGELTVCRSKLTVAEDRVGHLERQEDDLRNQIASIAVDLKSSQAECTRIRTDTESDKAQARLISQAALKTIADKLTVSQADNARLRADLVSAKEKLNTERMLAPEEMRKKLALVESSLEEEKALTHSLQADSLKKELSLKHWEELGSELLRKLHETQDELQVERTARRVLQTHLSMGMSEGTSAARRASTAD